MKRIVMISLLCQSFLNSNCVFANDTIGAVGAGGIEFKKTDDISMEKEVLTISRDLVRVEYDFVNKTDHPVQERILFPMPFFGFDYGCSPTHSGQLENFKVWVNGSSVKTSRTARARLSSGKDVTALLKNMGFTDEDIVEFRGVSSRCDSTEVTGKYAQNINQLSNEKLVPLYPGDKNPVPIWESAYVYYWEQLFPPRTLVKVSHEYIPFVGSDSGNIDFLEKGFGIKSPKELANRLTSGTDLCVDDGTFRAAKKAEQQLGGSLRHDVVKYVLKTGANWSGPIKDFTLNLKKSAPTDVVSLCFDGKFKKTNPLLLSTHREYFVPNKDISVLFIYYDSNYH